MIARDVEALTPVGIHNALTQGQNAWKLWQSEHEKPAIDSQRAMAFHLDKESLDSKKVRARQLTDKFLSPARKDNNDMTTK